MRYGLRFTMYAFGLVCLSLISIAAVPNITKNDFARLQNKAELLNSESSPLRYHIESNWNGEQWVEDSKESYIYDNLGRVAEVVTSNIEEGQWKDAQKSVLEYYGESEYIKKISMKVAPTGTYINFAIMDFKYDANWKMTEQIITVLIPNPFVRDTKIELTWNDDILAEVITYEKEGTEWVQNNKSTFQYKDSKELPSEEIEYVWEGGEWANELKTVYEFNENDSLSTTTEYTPKENEWVNSKKTVYEYNGLLKIKEKVYTWSEDWVSESQTDYSYNSNDKVQSDITQNWIADAWQNMEKNEYIYEQSSSINDDFNNELLIVVFPNPASDYISVPGIGNEEVTIMSVNGAVVRTAKSGVIDINSLAPGMYYVVSGSKTGRFVKY